MRSRWKTSRKVAPGYRTEAELCEDVIAWARAGECAVYPETEGWDILLVIPGGEQIGIQAKLKPNLHVIEQTLRGMVGNRGPDIVAAAVPIYDSSFRRVTEELGIMTIEGSLISPRGHQTFASWIRRAKRRATTERCWVPEVEINLPAGVPSPRMLTPWKFGAAKLCARLRAGEALTRKDFAEHGIRIDTWVARDWIRRVGKTTPARYELCEARTALPDRDFPEIVAALGLPPIPQRC